MRLPGRALLLAILAIILAACSGGSVGSPAAPSSTVVEPTPVVPSPAPVSKDYWLRLVTFQAIPPLNLFPVMDEAVITGDGVYVVQGAVPAIYPGPIVTPQFGQQVSAKGLDTIMQWASELGLLTGKTDFTGGGGMPGGVTGQIDLTVDGGRVTLTGLPQAQGGGTPAPGSPEAFAEFWRRVTSLPQTLAGELGPQAPYIPPAYALLVGAPPTAETGMTAQVMDWPLDTPLATFGGPVANGTARCGTVSGVDADILRPSLEKANQLTMWTQDPAFSAAYGLTVRPLVPGEDRCREVFGPG